MSVPADLSLLRRHTARVLHIVAEEHFQHRRWCRRCGQYFAVVAPNTGLFCPACVAATHDALGRTLDAPLIADEGKTHRP